MWTFSITGPVCQSSSEPKILLYSLNISSTIWFWYSMWTAMFPVSFSGLRSVGPNTIPKLCVDIRFTDSLAAILLTKGKNWLKTSGVKGVAVAFEVHRGIFFTDSSSRDVCLVKLSKRKERGREEATSASRTNKEGQVSPRQQDTLGVEVESPVYGALSRHNLLLSGERVSVPAIRQ